MKPIDPPLSFVQVPEWPPPRGYANGVVTTGRTASPPLFETMEVLGREITRRRMRQAVEFLNKLKA